MPPARCCCACCCGWRFGEGERDWVAADMMMAVRQASAELRSALSNGCECWEGRKRWCEESRTSISYARLRKRSVTRLISTQKAFSETNTSTRNSSARVQLWAFRKFRRVLVRTRCHSAHMSHARSNSFIGASVSGLLPLQSIRQKLSIPPLNTTNHTRCRPIRSSRLSPCLHTMIAQADSRSCHSARPPRHRAIPSRIAPPSPPCRVCPGLRW